MSNAEFENWSFLKMWPFKRNNIRRISISIEEIDDTFSGVAIVYKPIHDYSLFIYEDDFPEHFNEVYETVSYVVGKIKKWNKLEFENKERVEYERLKKKFG